MDFQFIMITTYSAKAVAFILGYCRTYAGVHISKCISEAISAAGGVTLGRNSSAEETWLPFNAFLPKAIGSTPVVTQVRFINHGSEGQHTPWRTMGHLSDSVLESL